MEILDFLAPAADLVLGQELRHEQVATLADLRADPVERQVVPEMPQRDPPGIGVEGDRVDQGAVDVEDDRLEPGRFLPGFARTPGRALRDPDGPPVQVPGRPNARRRILASEMRIVRKSAPGQVDPHPAKHFHEPRGSLRLSLDHGLDQVGQVIGVGVVPAEYQPAMLLSRPVETREVVAVSREQDPAHPRRVRQDDVVASTSVGSPCRLAGEHVMAAASKGLDHQVGEVLVGIKAGHGSPQCIASDLPVDLIGVLLGVIPGGHQVPGFQCAMVIQELGFRGTEFALFDELPDRDTRAVNPRRSTADAWRLDNPGMMQPAPWPLLGRTKVRQSQGLQTPDTVGRDDFAHLMHGDPKTLGDLLVRCAALGFKQNLGLHPGIQPRRPGDELPDLLSVFGL